LRNEHHRGSVSEADIAEFCLISAKTTSLLGIDPTKAPSLAEETSDNRLP
jgi:hypothetical protein